MFRQGFTCPALLKDQTTPYPYGAITHSGAAFHPLLVCVAWPLA